MVTILAIAKITLLELIRGKVLYLAIFFTAALVAVASLFGTVTIGDHVRVIKDFGLFSLSLCSVGFAVIAGSLLLANELARKTIYNVVSKPIPRGHFIIGKYLGLSLTTILMLALMATMLSCFLAVFEGQFDALMLSSYVFLAFDCLLVCALTVFFSSMVVTPLLTGLFTFGLFLAGRSVAYLTYFIRDGADGDPLKMVLRAAYWAIPNFDQLNIANDVVYGRGPSEIEILWSALYVVGYAGALIIIACFAFGRRDFN